MRAEPEGPGLGAGPTARDRVRHDRAREFLRSQTVILSIAIALVLGSNLAGVLDDVLAIQSVSFTAVIGAATAVGWWLVGNGRAPPHRVILGLLYADSLLGFLAFYAAGEFETPAIAILLLCVIMAPLYAGERHAWYMGLTQWLLYTGLLVVRQYGWMEGVFAYRYLLPPESVRGLTFVVDSWLSFTVACLGTTWLAGRASLDIVNSQAQLEGEVRSKTADLKQRTEELERAQGRLQEVNADLARANHQLQLSNGHLDQFNAAVSHDLRTPLQYMVSRAELLALTGRSNPERIQPMADAIIESAQRMALQLDELLKLARVVDRLAELEPVPLGRVASLASQDLSTELRRRRASIELVNPLPMALGNAALLQELFQNLFQNALKYGAQPHPRVRVETAPAPQGRVAVSVEDDGPGIPAGERERVFRLFQRMPRDQGVEGLGAGLAIVRRIIDVHGGSVRIEEGRALPGARFVVELPAEPPSPLPAELAPG
jgi:signal transduction histidine kinase